MHEEDARARARTYLLRDEQLLGCGTGILCLALGLLHHTRAHRHTTRVKEKAYTDNPAQKPSHSLTRTLSPPARVWCVGGEITCVGCVWLDQMCGVGVAIPHVHIHRRCAFTLVRQAGRREQTFRQEDEDDLHSPAASCTGH